MNWIARAMVAMLAAVLLGNAAPQEDRTICIGGPPWSGSLAEVSQIEGVPVPMSYRLRFESKDPCVRWGLDKESLVTWHLHFGSERSVAGALAYLERHFSAEVPPAIGYHRELQRAWERAGPDLVRALALGQPGGTGSDLVRRFMKQSRPIQRFQTLASAQGQYRFLMEQYLRAAEEFAAPSLLKKAENYLPAVSQGTSLIERLETQEPAAKILYLDADAFLAEDLSLRVAIMRARLSRSKADIDAAERVLRSGDRENYRRAAESAYSGGEGFCAISDDWGDAQALRAACKEDGAFKERVTNYWINRAMLDLVSDSAEVRNVELASALLDRERRGGAGRCCRRLPDEDMLRLLVATADHHRRRLAKASNDEDRDEAADSWNEALSALQKAERLAPVTSSPARFERIARAWLEVWRIGPALFESTEHLAGMTRSPDHRRYATYLQRLLGAVGTIAVGSDAGVPAETTGPDRPQ